MIEVPKYDEIPMNDTIVFFLEEGETMLEKFTTTKGRYIDGECLVCFSKYPSQIVIELFDLIEEE